MTINELIEGLKKFDGDDEVVIEVPASYDDEGVFELSYYKPKLDLWDDEGNGPVVIGYGG